MISSLKPVNVPVTRNLWVGGGGDHKARTHALVPHPKATGSLGRPHPKATPTFLCCALLQVFVVVVVTK